MIGNASKGTRWRSVTLFGGYVGGKPGEPYRHEVGRLG